MNTRITPSEYAANGFYVSQTRPLREEISMPELLDIWLESKKGCIKESSLAQYRRIVETILKPELNGWTTEAVDNDVVQGLVSVLQKRYSHATVQNVITITNQIFLYMNEQRYSPEILKGKVKGGGKKKRPDIFTRAEQRILTDFLMEDMDLFKMGVLLTLYSGLRVGELCGLQWQDIDPYSKIIRVKRTVQRISDGNGHTYFSLGTPKTVHSEREIPIPSSVLDIISRFKTDDPEAYVTSASKTFTQPRTYQNRLKKYLQVCGLPNYHFHTLRHTFASRAIELGFDPKSLSEILGHANVKITLDLYVHPSLEQKQREMELFCSLL